MTERRFQVCAAESGNGKGRYATAMQAIVRARELNAKGGVRHVVFKTFFNGDVRLFWPQRAPQNLVPPVGLKPTGKAGTFRP